MEKCTLEQEKGMSFATADLIIQNTHSVEYLNRNSRQKATKALFGVEYESNLHVKA